MPLDALSKLYTIRTKSMCFSKIQSNSRCFATIQSVSSKYASEKTSNLKSGTLIRAAS